MSFSIHMIWTSSWILCSELSLNMGAFEKLSSHASIQMFAPCKLLWILVSKLCTDMDLEIHASFFPTYMMDPGLDSSRIAIQCYSWLRAKLNVGLSTWILVLTLCLMQYALWRLLNSLCVPHSCLTSISHCIFFYFSLFYQYWLSEQGCFFLLRVWMPTLRIWYKTLHWFNLWKILDWCFSVGVRRTTIPR